MRLVSSLIFVLAVILAGCSTNRMRAGRSAASTGDRPAETKERTIRAEGRDKHSNREIAEAGARHQALLGLARQAGLLTSTPLFESASEEANTTVRKVIRGYKIVSIHWNPKKGEARVVLETRLAGPPNRPPRVAVFPFVDGESPRGHPGRILLLDRITNALQNAGFAVSLVGVKCYDGLLKQIEDEWQLRRASPRYEVGDLTISSESDISAGNIIVELVRPGEHYYIQRELCRLLNADATLTVFCRQKLGELLSLVLTCEFPQEDLAFQTSIELPENRRFNDGSLKEINPELSDFFVMAKDHLTGTCKKSTTSKSRPTSKDR